MAMTGAWWRCPSCDTPVPFAYQLEESFDEDGTAAFDPDGSIGPGSDAETLAACWLRVVRCPNEDCDRAWALALDPATKPLVDDRAVAVPA